MIDLGLTQASFLRLCELLVSDHEIAIVLQLMDLNHNHLGDISEHLLGGQVTLDADAQEATRQASLELLDPDYKLNIDPDSPEDGSLYMKQMIRIHYVVISPDRREAFPIPIFTGPLTAVDRNGPIISVEALGKESLANSGLWRSRTLKKGLKLWRAMEIVLKEVAGEKRYHLRKTSRKLGSKLVLNMERSAWQGLRKLAKISHSQVFYDGRGVMQSRKLPSKIAYTFKTQGALLSNPSIGYDAQAIVNAVRVIGGKPKGKKKKRIVVSYVVLRSHELSPYGLGRKVDGKVVPNYRPEVIQDDSIKSKKAARKLARARVNNSLLESVEVAFDCLPIPFLEEYDKCRLVTDDWSGAFRLRKMTIPLTADGKSTVGYLKRVSVSKRANRVKSVLKRRAP